jgi:hypothetical protein
MPGETIEETTYHSDLHIGVVIEERYSPGVINVTFDVTFVRSENTVECV